MIKPIYVQAVAEVADLGRYPEGYATEPNGLGYRKNSRREDAEARKWRGHFNSVLVGARPSWSLSFPERLGQDAKSTTKIVALLENP